MKGYKMVEIQAKSVEDVVGCESVENLLLMAVLGNGLIRTSARRELERRRVVESRFEFEDSYMTNLSVVD